MHLFIEFNVNITAVYKHNVVSDATTNVKKTIYLKLYLKNSVDTMTLFNLFDGIV